MIYDPVIWRKATTVRKGQCGFVWAVKIRFRHLNKDYFYVHPRSYIKYLVFVGRLIVQVLHPPVLVRYQNEYGIPVFMRQLRVSKDCGADSVIIFNIFFSSVQMLCSARGVFNSPIVIWPR